MPRSRRLTMNSHGLKSEEFDDFGSIGRDFWYTSRVNKTQEISNSLLPICVKSLDNTARNNRIEVVNMCVFVYERICPLAETGVVHSHATAEKNSSPVYRQCVGVCGYESHYVWVLEGHIFILNLVAETFTIFMPVFLHNFDPYITTHEMIYGFTASQLWYCLLG